MKLTKDQKIELKLLKAMTTVEGNTVPNLLYLEDAYTIAWARPFQGSKMVAVSVSYYDQNEDGRYRKSTGAYFALKRLQSNEFVQVPLGNFGDTVINSILIDMFDL